MSKNIKIPLIIGQQGLVGFKSQAVIGPSALLIARNISYFGGIISRIGGSAKYNATAITGTPVILGGNDWNPSFGVQRAIVYTDAGNLLKDSGSGTFATTLKSGLSTSPYFAPMFISGGAETMGNSRKLFVFNGANPVQVLAADGGVTADLALPPADWSGSNQPSFGIMHDNRIWGGGNFNDAHRIYYSTLANHEDFQGADAGTISVYPGEGEYLTGGISYMGYLILFKYPFGIYAVNTADPTPANWSVVSLSKTIGLPGPDAITKYRDMLIFMDITGSFYLIMPTNATGAFSILPLSEGKGMNIYSSNNINLDASVLRKIQSISYKLKNEVIFAVPSSFSTVNDTSITLDFNSFDLNNVSSLRFKTEDKDICQSLWLKKDSIGQLTPVCGDDAGFVWLLDQDNHTKDGGAYTSEFKTSETDFSYFDAKLANITKNGQFLEFTYDTVSNWDMSVDVYWDGQYSETISFGEGLSGSTLGSFTFGVDDLAGGSTVLTSVKKLHGWGRTLALRFVSSGLDTDFSISKAFIHVTLGDEKV